MKSSYEKSYSKVMGKVTNEKNLTRGATVAKEGAKLYISISMLCGLGGLLYRMGG